MTKTLELSLVREHLLHAVTRYDRKQAKRKDYNIYALAQYMIRLDESISAASQPGFTVETAIMVGFNGALRDWLLKALFDWRVANNSQ